jgi:hypothetical protein
MTSHSRRHAVGAVILSGAAALFAGTAGSAQTAPASRTIFLSVTDKQGAPALDLTAADFAVKEDGKARPVVKAELTALPVQSAVLVDDIGVGSDTIKAALDAFTAGLKDHGEVVVTTWRRTTSETIGFQSEESADGAKAMTASNGEPPHLLEHVLAASEAFAGKQAAHPVIIVITPADEDAGNVRMDDVVRSLGGSRAQLYVFNLAAPALGGLMNDGRQSDGSTPTMKQLSLNDTPERTGGRLEHNVSLGNLQDKLQQLAVQLTHQYALEYRSAPARSGVKLAVDVQRKGVKVTAPTRVD